MDPYCSRPLGLGLSRGRGYKLVIKCLSCWRKDRYYQKLPQLEAANEETAKPDCHGLVWGATPVLFWGVISPRSFTWQMKEPET